MSTRKTRSAGTAMLDVEYRIRRMDDGAVRWISRRAEIVQDADGTAMLARGVVQDITPRKLAEATLRQSEARFRALAQAVPNHVWTATADGQVDWVSDYTSDYVGLASHELIGDGWRRIVHPEDLPRLDRLRNDALAHVRTYEIAARLRRHDGEFRWHLARAQPVESMEDAGPQVRWVGINTDIEDHKAALLAHSVAAEADQASRPSGVT
jgi:PAS domain S-box-containing protein